MTYEQARDLYLNSVPGAEVNTPQGQQAFNSWSGQSFGPGGFESAGAPNVGALSPMSPTAPGGAGGTPAPVVPPASLPTPTSIGGPLNDLHNQIAGIGGNTNQVQGGSQTGAYGTSGTNYSGTDTNQAQTTSGNTANTGTSNTAAGQHSDQTTTGSTTGTTTNNVVDNYGIGSLANGLTGSAGGLDASRNSFLQGAMANGDPALGKQTDIAVHSALSGPGMAGAGESARARAAGYAAEDVANTSFGRQLAAAQTAGGPSASGSAVQQLSPLLGSTQSVDQQTLGKILGDINTSSATNTANTGTTSGITNTTGKQNTVGGNTASGVATGSNLSAAAGTVPQQNVSSGSGCFVCTAYVERGWMKPGAIRRAVKYKLNNKRLYEKSLLGYVVFGPPLARAVLRSKVFASCFYPVARWVLQHECHLADPTRVKSIWYCRVAHTGFDGLGKLFGIWVSRKYTMDSTVVGILNKHNLNFGENW